MDPREFARRSWAPLPPSADTLSESRKNELMDYALRWLALKAPEDITLRGVRTAGVNFVTWFETHGAALPYMAPTVAWQHFVMSIGGMHCLPLYLRLLS